jgi:hypothetical protein
VVKTTIILDDDIYRRLVEEAVKQYGSTRTLSRLINKKLREAEGKRPVELVKRSTVRLGRELREGEIRRMIQEGWEEATRWKR